MQAQVHFNLTEFKIHIEANKKAWNKRTPIHIKSKFYNMKNLRKVRIH